MFIEFKGIENPRVSVALDILVPKQVKQEQYLIYNCKTERFYIRIILNDESFVIRNSIYAKSLYRRVNEELLIHGDYPILTMGTYLKILENKLSGDVI